MECCHRLLPLVVHSILLDDSDGSWRSLLSSHIQDFFGFCSTPLNSHSGEFDVSKSSELNQHFHFEQSGFFYLHKCLYFYFSTQCTTFFFFILILLLARSESDSASQGSYDKASLRTLLAVVDYLRHQRRPLAADRSALILYRT